MQYGYQNHMKLMMKQSDVQKVKPLPQDCMVEVVVAFLLMKLHSLLKLPPGVKIRKSIGPNWPNDM